LGARAARFVRRRAVSSHRSTVLILTLLLYGCATHKPAPVNIDLAPARQVIESARVAGAEERAPQDYAQALEYLRQGETALGKPSPESATKAERLGTLAMESALRALFAAQAARPVAAPPPANTASRADLAELRAKLEGSEAERRRLEEHVAQLQREKDLLNREVLRAKVRLKGAASTEEASSAIAEARTLLSLVPQTAGPLLSQCADSISKAEAKFRLGNYGAALFLALEAQEEASEAGASASASTATGLKKSYTVKSPANLRKGPALGEGVLSTLAPGSVVSVLGAQGEWIHVQAGDLTGWLHRTLLD
jgi:hypothetical protein